ncbi:WhiB family transcriptional regulator [Streptomyces ramulosus]|uniref:WhiB family transcriptional regulator n=1 Tax=Streptomyces TaxID=1883 RepID=UPI0031E98860
MPTLMSPARARGTRLPHLQTDVDAHASCAPHNTPADQRQDWFRADGEPGAEWDARSIDLKSICESCPVLAQCREIALRLDAPNAAPDMVRGGLTGAELRARRKRHRDSILRATAADHAFLDRGDEERRRIRALNTTIRAAHRPAAVEELRELRAARRRRAGWTRAA